MHLPLSAALILPLACDLVSARNVKRQSAATLLYQFTESGASVENLAVRSNGEILLTRFDVGQIFAYDISARATAEIARFPASVNNTAGITELAEDVFAIVGGQYSNAGGPKPGSWGIYKLDMNAATPGVTLVKAFPGSTMFNGLTTFDNDTVLIGEGKGSVIKLKISTGESSIAVEDPSMSPPSGAPIPLGIDGMRYFNGSLYYSNIFAGTFNKVKLDASGKKAGNVTTILTNQQGDDLCIAKDGTVYLTTNNKDILVKITPDGKSSTFATVKTGTSCAFGRTDRDSNVMYISSGAGALYSLRL